MFSCDTVQVGLVWRGGGLFLHPSSSTCSHPTASIQIKTYGFSPTISPFVFHWLFRNRKVFTIINKVTMYIHEPQITSSSQPPPPSQTNVRSCQAVLSLNQRQLTLGTDDCSPNQSQSLTVFIILGMKATPLFSLENVSNSHIRAYEKYCLLFIFKVQLL